MDLAHRHEGPLSRLKSRLVWLGIALTILGILAIATPWAAAAFVDFMVAGSLLAAGVTQLGAAAGTFTWRGFWLTVLCGSLSLVAGTAMLAIPAEGVHAMTVFIGLVFLFQSAAKLTAAFAMPRDFPWGWMLADGLLAAVLGGMLLISPTQQSGVFLGTLIGINLLASGAAFLASGLWLKERLG
ncbi:MAG: HdeD family acid-resistance protein [Pirellulales bacterium]